jgi:hypothetical protein
MAFNQGGSYIEKCKPSGKKTVPKRGSEKLLVRRGQNQCASDEQKKDKRRHVYRPLNVFIVKECEQMVECTVCDTEDTVDLGCNL